MKKLLVLIALAQSLWAQIPEPPIEPPTQSPRFQYSSSYNGTTQYLSKTSPVSMDLNGSELLSNTTFDSDINGWTVKFGSSTVSQNTHLDRVRTGTGSLLIVTDTAKQIAGAASPAMFLGTSNIGTIEFWVFAPSTDSVSNPTVRIALRDSNLNLIVATLNTNVTKNVWQKLVLNRTMNSGTGGWCKISIDQATNNGFHDSLYVDDVSLTQAYDAMIVTGVKTSSSAGATRYITIAATTASSPFYGTYQISGTNLVGSQVTDGTTTVNLTTGGTALNDGRFHLLITTLARTGSITKYLDGTSIQSSSIAAVGKVTVNATSVGGNTNGTSLFTGYIIPTQYIIFQSGLPSNIASIIAGINATWKTEGLPTSYSGGTIVFNLDMTSPYDKSGNQGMLTNNGGVTFGNKIPRGQ